MMKILVFLHRTDSTHFECNYYLHTNSEIFLILSKVRSPHRGQCLFLVIPIIQYTVSKQLVMHFEAKQSFIKYNGYYFMNVIHYRNNISFTKQRKSTPNMGWLVLWGTRGSQTQSRKTNLTFRGPCIVIYSYNESQRDELFLNFILVNNSTCLGQQICPKHVEFFIKINLRNSAYRWLSLQENNKKTIQGFQKKQVLFINPLSLELDI